MTLYRQLFIFTVLIITILFLGVWVEKLQSTRSFLESQLASHAQDTATSLGLSLSPFMVEGDIPTVDTMMNAVFDRGYYRIISLKDNENNVITERVLKVEIAGVPDWFINLIPIKAPSKQSLVMSGWMHAGTLYVESHPGLAYKTLWDTMIQISIYFVIAGLILLFIGSKGLQLILKPLKHLEEQAEAVCRKEYQIQEILPKTKELRQVVESMNRMIAHVREMFTRQVKVAERLRQKAYTDMITGLGNRRYIKAQVSARVEGASSDIQGALLMLQIEDLQKINDTEGFLTGDALLKRVARILRQETKMFNDVALARLTGGDFAVFIVRISEADAFDITERLSANVTKLAMENISPDKNIAHIGGVVFESPPTLAELLAGADSALQAAKKQGPNRWVLNNYSEGESSAVKGKSWWKQTFDSVLERGDIILCTQPVISSDKQGKIIHHELLSRIRVDEDSIVNAGVFVPIAERTRLISRLDKTIISKIFQQNQHLAQMQTIAVNVSPTSLSDSDFVEWLLTELAKIQPQLHIIFEFPEFGAVQHMDALKYFSHKVQQSGHAIALDHFGQSFAHFGYLKSLRPEYVKIDRAFTKELETDLDGDASFFIEALAGVAHSLDILVIAEGVEREEQVTMLQQLNIDAFQGFLFAKPRQLD